MNPNNARIDFRDLAKQVAKDNLSLLPVVEKELIHYDILRAMQENDFLESLCFQGGTALRLCYGSERLSEDLIFTGGSAFDPGLMSQLKECIEDYLSAKYGLLVEVRSPKENKQPGIAVSSWQVKVITAKDRPDIAAQKIKIEVANVPSYSRELVQISENYTVLTTSPLIIGVQSMDEIMADKLLALPASEKVIRYRDLWDLHWLSLRKMRPNIDLIRKKVRDYGVSNYPEKRLRCIQNLPEMIESADFRNQMSRFLKQETISNTIARADVRSAMVGNLTRLLQECEGI